MANPGEIKLTLWKIDDRTAYTLAKRLQKMFEIPESEKVNLRLASGLNASEDAYVARNIKSGEYTIPALFVSGTSGLSHTPVEFYFERYPDRNHKNPQSPDNDFVSLNLGPNLQYWEQNPTIVTRAIHLIMKDQMPTSGLSTDKESSILRELIIGQSATHQRMMDELNRSIVEMTSKREALEADAAEQEAKRRQEYQEAINALESERQELQRHSHMSERRRIATTIAQRIQEEALQSLRPKGVTTTAWAVFGATMAAGLVGAASAYGSFVEFSKRQAAIRSLFTAVDGAGIDQETLPSMVGDLMWATDWYLIGRMVLSSLVAIGFFTYAASWMKRYYDEDTRRQREMERFNNDILRASWIVEAVQEIKHEAKAELPPEWVEAVTRNMFDQNNQNSADEGILAMKALMGFAAKTTIGRDGLEVEVNRRGNRKLAKTESSGE